jgi:aspartate aminotransferase-like enzyme
MNLRIPGPTPVPQQVLDALSHPMVDHRGPEFSAVVKRVHERLPIFFQTKNDILSLTTAGTGGLEAAVVNVLSPGDTVLSVSIGNFGERLAKIAATFGANVVSDRYEDGEAADPARVQQALLDNPAISAVMITHNETSTGVTNDLQALAKVARDAGKLIIVDAVSSLAAIDLPVDEWDCDVVVTGSQKGWMVPPGLAFVSMSPRAWAAYEISTMPKFYFDLKEHKKSLAKGETPWTPVLPIYFGLDVALDMMLAEGLPAIVARHERIGQAARDGVKRLGCSLLAADERRASNTVTAVYPPAGVDVKTIRSGLRDEGFVVAGGQGGLSGKIFRIGHLGLVSDQDIADTLAALGRVLAKAAVPA